MDLFEFKKELDNISPTFCVAKWKQSTVHLENGLTHSCHHPGAHIIPLNELEKNVTALHNTIYKKGLRKAMIEGKIVDECEYCNRIERNSKHSLSDRVYKSSESWAKDYIPEIISNPWDYDVFPSYFEVSFSATCNCKCMYCSPRFSTPWINEIEKYGGYPTSISSRDSNDSPPPKYLNSLENPYIEAFWKWWPDLYKKLKVFRITGGEPLLDKNTFKIIDFLIENPKPDLQFGINSNLCINTKLLNKFIEKIKILSDKGMIVNAFTSCEASGSSAEYIRYGMNYNKWLANCQRFLREVPNGILTIMSTYNILSITTFTNFLNDVLQLKKEFPNRVLIDIPFLMNPPYFQANIITKDFLPYIEESITFMYTNHIPEWKPLASSDTFSDQEISKLIRIYFMVEAKPENKSCLKFRKDFSIFVDEYDRRKGTNFLGTFPEYKQFYNKYKNIEV